MIVEPQAGDILLMKKPHPCGQRRFLVLRGAEAVRVRCLGCGREMELPLGKLSGQIRQIVRPEKDAT